MSEERPSQADEMWRSMLLGDYWQFSAGRRILKHLPSEPRCKLCAAPFRGAGAPFMRLIGKAPWPKNPKYCGSCFKVLESNHGGAEIPCSLLFADVRGSTRLAESMRPSEFRTLMDRFFETAAAALVEHDAIVDKFVGDQVIGLFIPALNGDEHAARAIASARALIAATRASDLPVGVGVHTGIAFVGSVGAGTNVDLTAMGDPVNVTARLASAAGAGEILVSADAARASGLDDADLERRELELKGKSEVVSVVVITPTTEVKR